MTGQPNGHPSVLVVVSSNHRRGAEVFGATLVDALAQTGWHTRFVALAGANDGPTVDAEPLSNLTPAELGKLDRSVIASLRKFVTEEQPDIVLANGSSTLQYLVAAVRWQRKRPRLVYSSIGEPMWWIRNTRHRVIRTAILKGADRVLSVSATTAAQLVEHLGVPEHKIRIAPTGVPERFFVPVEGPRPEGGPLRIVWIGSLSEEKGPLDALRVMALAGERTAIQGRFLGDGPLRSQLERAVDGTSIADRIDVVGSVADVVPHLVWGDVLLMTSKTEGLPGVALEAGAAGVPGVVFDAGGSREAVVHDESGFVVAKGDIDAAAAAIARLGLDRELLARMSVSARLHVADNYTLDAAVARYIDLLNDELVDIQR